MARRTYGTGSVTPYGEGRYRLRWWANGAQRSKVVHAGTRKEAEVLLRAELSDVDQGVAVEPSVMRVAEMLDLWLRDEVAPRVKATTLEQYQRTIATHVVPRLGKERIQELSKADIVAFRATLVRECGSRTAQQAFDRFTAALAWAAEMEWVKRDVSTGVKRPPHEDGEAHAFSAAEAASLLHLAKDDHYAPLWQLYLWTGLRRGEGLGLRWRDLDLNTGALSVRQQVVLTGTPRRPTIQSVKTKASRRTIGVDETLVVALEDHRTAQLAAKKRAGHWFDHGLVFCTRNGLPINPDHVRRRFDAFMVTMGFPERTVHDCRHTHASLLLMRGVSLLEVSHRLGHSNPQITAEVYAKWIPGSEERSIEAIRGMLEGGSTPPELPG